MAVACEVPVPLMNRPSTNDVGLARAATEPGTARPSTDTPGAIRSAPRLFEPRLEKSATVQSLGSAEPW